MPIEPLQKAAHREEWIRLLESSRSASAHLHPDVVDAATKGRLIHRQWGEAKSLASLGVLAPKTVRVLKMRGIGGAGALSGYRVVADRLLGNADEGACETFISECAALLDVGAADCVVFDDLDADSPLWRQAHAVAERNGLRVVAPSGVQPHWWIRFPDPPAEYWKAFSSKTRNTFKRKSKKLEHTMTRVDSPEQVEAFLKAAHHISRNTWQTRRLGLRVRNDEHERDEYLRLARAGALRCYLLEHADGRPLAFMIGLQLGDVFVYEEVGYDTEYARRSPGTVLLYRVLNDLIADRPPRLFDFGTGHADYKALFGNHQTHSGPLMLVANRLKPNVAVGLERARRAVDQRARGLLRKTGVYDRVRRRYRS